MNFQQTLNYLYSQLPMFQRIGVAAYKNNLDNTIALCNLLKNPQNNFKSIHIAGTNGKGSTSHLIASILQTKGLKIGLYTSPHLKDFRERIRINGKKIPKKFVTSFVNEYKNDFEKINPSFFEMTFGMAIKYFADEKIDLAIMETGMGGRLDSTNIINPVVSVITNISFDHTQFLGNTLEKIAIEKAGIIKPCTPVIIGETQNNLKHIFINKAEKQNAPIYFADSYFKALNIKYTNNRISKLCMDIFSNNKLYLKNLNSSLTGLYQYKNIITSLQIIKILNKTAYNINKTQIKKGIGNVVKQTGISGRWQIISNSPLTICDTAHNADGIKEVVNQIKTIPYKNLHFVLGMVNDKNINNILRLLPQSATYYFCKADIPRGLDQGVLAEKANIADLKGEIYPSVNNALANARNNAEKNDLVFIGGSSFVVAEVL
ncbi:MAG: bifunctional folylpolyglutamate synthase/dihydrofolate synthase [Bacteroidales bacterium]|nr:bifunctional folylpolyglutamate synthase/dihydrofolate synthase [Bacteroidales bacterium]